MKINLDSKNLELAEKSNVSHESAEEMYGCYGTHYNKWWCAISTDHDGYVCIRSVDYDWLDDEQAAEVLLAERRPHMTADECETLVSMARRIREAMEGIEDALERASCAAIDGDLAGCIEALQEARGLETDHGDHPSTSALADQLLREKKSQTRNDFFKSVDLAPTGPRPAAPISTSIDSQYDKSRPTQNW